MEKLDERVCTDIGEEMQEGILFKFIDRLPACPFLGEILEGSY